VEGQISWYEGHPDGFALVRQAIGTEEPEVVFVSKEIAVAYTFERQGSYITHKHGPPTLVEAWAENSRTKLRKTVKNDMLLAAMLPRVIKTDRWEVEDLNWVCQNINGLNRLARKFAELGLVL
jgi:hypothetical protein